MPIVVPFLSEQEIEQSALRLLRQSGFGTSNGFNGIVPVERILERNLKLSLDFDDLHVKFDVPRTGLEPEVLGALWVQRREVFIDQSLDPEENPSIEGRYRFTVAHEIGHWWLHRDYIQVGSTEIDLFGEKTISEGRVVCRASKSREPIEWQADTFAANLLMPAGLVHYWWRESFSRTGPLIFELYQHDSDWTRPPMGWRGVAILAHHSASRFDASAVSYFFYRASKEIAPRFGVSVQAMQLRLERMGLLLIQRPSQVSAAGFR